MPKIPFHSHLSSVTLSILPLPFSALAKLQIRNKVNSLAFQVQFILTIFILPGQKRWSSSQMWIVWFSRLGSGFGYFGFFGFFSNLIVSFGGLVVWHKFKLWACAEWVIFNKRGEHKLTASWMGKFYPCYSSSGFFCQNICLWFIAISSMQEL